MLANLLGIVGEVPGYPPPPNFGADLCTFDYITNNAMQISQNVGYLIYTLSHNYVSQSFSVIIHKIVCLRRFPFQAVITDSSGDRCRKNHH